LFLIWNRNRRWQWGILQIVIIVRSARWRWSWSGLIFSSHFFYRYFWWWEVIGEVVVSILGHWKVQSPKIPLSSCLIDISKNGWYHVMNTVKIKTWIFHT